MAYGFINVSRGNPCPICGKPDWCGWMPPTGEHEGTCLVCQRDTVKGNQVGFDGRHYVYVCDTKSGNSLYMELDDYEEQQRYRNKGYERRRKDKTFKKAEKIYASPRTFRPVNSVDPKNPKELDAIYRYLVTKLKLKDEHRKYLYSQGWTDEMIRYYHVVSFPESDKLREKNKRNDINITRAALAASIEERFGKNSLLGVPGAYTEDGTWTFYGPSGILFPMYDIDGNNYRMRIRRDFKDQYGKIHEGLNGTDDYVVIDNKRQYLCMKGMYFFNGDGQKEWLTKGGKYRTLSSYHEDKAESNKGVIVNSLMNGCRSENAVSCYRPEKSDPNTVIITEGEPKGAYTAMKLGAEVWTIPGVSSYSLALTDESISYFKNHNKTVLVAFDADKITNKNVLKTEQSLINGLLEKGIAVMKLEWDINIGKGIDDNLAAGGTFRFVPAELER